MEVSKPFVGKNKEEPLQFHHPSFFDYMLVLVDSTGPRETEEIESLSRLLSQSTKK